MSAPTLRQDQLDVIAQIESEIAAGRRRLCVPARPGWGKTVVAAALIANAVVHGRRVLFLAHRRELIKQASAKLLAAGVLDHAILAAGFPVRLSAPVQVSSIPTLYRRAVRTRTIDLPAADVLFVDEAHHARARTYEKLIAAYPHAIVIGLTATPCRADGRGLGNVFQRLIPCPSHAELTKSGILVSAKFYAPVRPNLKGVRVERGDYVESQLAERMDKAKLVGDIVSHWHKLGERRRTVVFATGVAHSVHVRDEFRRSGVLAEHIDGSTPVEERDAILARLAAGTVDLVCNAMVLTEGWDRPEVSCLILARPTKSLGLYLQMVGRVLRSSPGKTDALILDHSGAVFQHGFPDDEISWTLDTDKKAVNEAHAVRQAEPHSRGLATCLECHAVRVEGQPCGSCGWHPVKRPKPVEIADGELGYVDRNRVVRRLVYGAEEKFRFYRQLLYIANERGYQIGWAAHKHKEKFGEWPPNHWRGSSPLAPSPEVRAFVRSRQIAYAKSRARRAS
jgi:DNA repair protein RadD